MLIIIFQTATSKNIHFTHSTVVELFLARLSSRERNCHEYTSIRERDFNIAIYRYLSRC